MNVFLTWVSLTFGDSSAYSLYCFSLGLKANLSRVYEQFAAKVSLQAKDKRESNLSTSTISICRVNGLKVGFFTLSPVHEKNYLIIKTSVVQMIYTDHQKKLLYFCKKCLKQLFKDSE